MGYAIVARPIDTLFFRDGAPFNAGETGFIKSIFPPTPQTGYGFSRAALLNAFCKRMVEYIKHGC
jgi:CRISPR/Cas system CMR-associated protein Cmr3 (group 5 of RAMP superfamily)